jgi:hypothetical protein
VKIERKEIAYLTKLIIEAGYGKEEGDLSARVFAMLEREVAPIAEAQGISLIDAAFCVADQDEEQDTSSFQLWEALHAIPIHKRRWLADIHDDACPSEVREM